MEPQTPVNYNGQPQPFTPGPINQQIPPAPHSKKRLIIIIVVVALLIGIIGLLWVVSKKDSKTPAGDKGQKGSLTTENNILKSSPGNIVSYNGTPVVQPCAIITPEDIYSAGLSFEKGLPGALERNQFDGVGQSPLPVREMINEPIGADANECVYVFSDRHTLRMNTIQPSYAPGPIVKYQVGKYSRQPDIAGVKVYRQERQEDNEKFTYYIFEAPHAAIFAMFELADDKRDILAKRIATRLNDSQTNPTPLQKVSLASKVVQNPVDNCNVIDNKVFTDIMGQSPWPLMKELWVPSEIDVKDSDTGKVFLYTQYSCERQYRIEDKGLTFSIRFEADTYQTEEGAKNAYDFVRRDERATRSNDEEITPAIGNESFLGDVAKGENTIVFRKGRVVAYAKVYLSTQLEKTISREERKSMIIDPVRKAVERHAGSFSN